MKGGFEIVLLEENAAVRKRIGRVLSVGADLHPIYAQDRAELESLPGKPQLIGCGLNGVSLLSGWLQNLPSTRVLTWGTRNSQTMLSWAAADRRFGHFVAWPEFSSMPKPADLLITARRLLVPGAFIHVTDLLSRGAAAREFRPASTNEMENVVSRVRALCLAMHLNNRQAERVAVVTHELLMNAIYGAPVAKDGLAKYAHDRKSSVQLLREEAPKLTFATDGVRLGIQVRDPFGRLERAHVFDGISRGLQPLDATKALDTSRGGAGLGLFRIFDAAHALFFDVRPGRRTDVIAVFELDVTLREQRSMPTTICFFED